MKDLREIVNYDCRHIRWDRPCAYHKEEGVICHGCRYYDPIQRRFLLIKLAADGDVLRSTGILARLHEEQPGVHVTWVTAPRAAPLLSNHPLIDRILVTSGETPPELVVEEFDTVFCPDADPLSCALATLARTGRHRGFTLLKNGGVRPVSPGAANWFHMGLNDELKRQGDRPYSQIMAEVLELVGPMVPPQLHLTPAELEEAQAFRRRVGIPEGIPLVGLNTGAGARWPKKQWTYQGFLTLGRELVKKGCRVLLLGGPDEEERNARLLAEGGEGYFSAGSHNPVRDFAARLGLCDLLVTGDTLALHIGVALGKPVVATFGPTSSAEIDLFDRGEKVVPAGMTCLCCYLSHCDREPSCQESISVEQVLDAVDRWL